MFDDSMEIYSPGGLFGGGTLDGKNLMNIPSKRRNPTLADIFSRLKYMERRGSGFKKILSSYRGHDGFSDKMEPTFRIAYDSFFLVLPRFKIENLQGGQSATQTTTQTTTQKILDLMIRNPHIKIFEIAEAVSITRDGVNWQIKQLKRKGVIRRIGGDI